MFKDRLRHAMALRHFSARKLADLSGVPYSSLSKYLNGHKSPGVEAAISITNALNVSADWLWLGKGCLDLTSDNNINEEALFQATRAAIDLSKEFQLSEVQQRTIVTMVYKHVTSNNEICARYLDDIRKLLTK